MTAFSKELVDESFPFFSSPMVDSSGNEEGSEVSEPLLVESDVSLCDDESHSSFEDDASISIGSSIASISTIKTEREPLRWQFAGLTIWLEMEEFDKDLTKVIQNSASSHGLKPIPKTHMTAIYGMNHLNIDEARTRLRSFVKLVCPAWPKFEKPVGVVQDIAVNGRPGQVCDVAWAELTMSSNHEHEDALDALYKVFYPEELSRPSRDRPWKPHNSIVYDNPENSSCLSLLSVMECIMKYPTLLSKRRNVEAISLWDTNGTMQEWKCLERVYFKA